jgi:hypothetical protein
MTMTEHTQSQLSAAEQYVTETAETLKGATAAHQRARTVAAQVSSDLRQAERDRADYAHAAIRAELDGNPAPKKPSADVGLLEAKAKAAKEAVENASQREADAKGNHARARADAQDAKRAHEKALAADMLRPFAEQLKHLAAMRGARGLILREGNVSCEIQFNPSASGGYLQITFGSGGMNEFAVSNP